MIIVRTLPGTDCCTSTTICVPIANIIGYYEGLFRMNVSCSRWTCSVPSFEPPDKAQHPPRTTIKPWIDYPSSKVCWVRLGTALGGNATHETKILILDQMLRSSSVTTVVWVRTEFYMVGECPLCEKEREAFESWDCKKSHSGYRGFGVLPKLTLKVFNIIREPKSPDPKKSKSSSQRLQDAV